LDQNCDDSNFDGVVGNLIQQNKTNQSSNGNDLSYMLAKTQEGLIKKQTTIQDSTQVESQKT